MAVLFLTIHLPNTYAQSPDRQIEFTHLHDLPSTCSHPVMTMRHDERNRPFLYVAAKSGGLRVYDMSDQPKLVCTIPVDKLEELDVCSLDQEGPYLYLALGNIFGATKQASGLAILNVSVPDKTEVTSVWTSDDYARGGAAVVRCHADTVYLGAMSNGLLILDVVDRANPRLVSVLKPNVNFPDKRAGEKKVNARGMALQGDHLFLCYDAGGLRVIDVSDRQQPIEVGRWVNPVMQGKPRAYNNVLLDGDHAYVAVDYCGIEVLDISDPTNPTLAGWWNPWNCEESGWTWFKSPGHANELDLDGTHELLFVSTGQSDLHVVDVTDPSEPRGVAVYGGLENEVGTWGVAMYASRVYLSYICTFGIPFKSNWSGVKVLEFNTSK